MMMASTKTMNSNGIGWESLLLSDAPSGCSLKAALLTTYDCAEERLLAEHLLPLLLRLDHQPDSDRREQQYFLLELDRRLKQLHDKIVVVSSTQRDEPTDVEESEGIPYRWLWRSIRHMTVGSEQRAVQHAKLWMFHWGSSDDGGGEYLEIVVSSANLTRSAFRSQLQAAWRCFVPLHPKASNARLTLWGVLPHFIRALASSSGDPSGLNRYLDLLARAECPENATFVASAPGTHSARELRLIPWGAAGLREITPPGRGGVKASILSPYIGSWNPDALTRWCEHFGGTPSQLNLVWIDNDHPWARTGTWLLPEATLKALNASKATLRHLRYVVDDEQSTDLFHDRHRSADPRWSHAKVYALRRGNSHRLLVTSANFSRAAWGQEKPDGSLEIENFELGVSVSQAAWPFEHLEPFSNLRNAATVTQLPKRSSNAISWARATWNGKNVLVECRCSNGSDLTGQVVSSGVSVPIPKWQSANGPSYKASLAWRDTHSQPNTVVLTCGKEAINVAIFDERPVRDREASVPTDVDDDMMQGMRDTLLFEQYGGLAADALVDPLGGDSPSPMPSTENDGNDAEDSNVAGDRDSYAVPAFVLARRNLQIVDNWATRMTRNMSDGGQLFERQVVRHDGELLVEAFKRQALREAMQLSANAIGGQLAVEELLILLKHFPETE